MMGMKKLGVKDIEQVERRAFRLLSLGRINKEDADHISAECSNLTKYIMEMEEFDGSGKTTRDPADRS